LGATVRIGSFWSFIKRTGKHEYRADFSIELKLLIMAQLVQIVELLLSQSAKLNRKIIFKKYEFGFVLNSTYYIVDNSGFFSIASKTCTDLMKIKTPIDKISLRFGALLQKKFFLEDPGSRFFNTRANEIRLEKKPYQGGVGYPVDWWGLNYKNLPLLEFFTQIKQKFSVSKEVYLIREKLINKYNIEFDKVIAVHIRGTDKEKEISLNPVSVFIDAINKQVIKFPNHKILLQTDDIKVQDYLNVYFKEKIFYFSEIEPSKSKIGSHNLSKKDPILFTQTYLATVLILSESEILITHTGNGALWEFIIRNKFNLSNENSIYQL
jgi:hypothetical protein